ncbi:MAG: helix-turn-helix domain-containing protein [Lachnospiraceae bacterium]|nr:helix-turn-helix domain-containing protein [Lachnospiraceae bacterium]
MAGQDVQFDFSIFHESRTLEASFDLLKIIYIVDGSCSVTTSNETALMQKADVLLLNPMEEARIEAGDNLFCAVLEIPFFEMLRETERSTLRFYLDSTKESGGRIREIQHILRGLLMCFLRTADQEHYKARGLYYLMLQTLLDDFSLLEKADAGVNDRDEKTQEILRYVWMNYRSEISLTEISDRLYISRSTASRLFKQSTGEDFPEYLKNLRLRAVLRELRDTDHSITDIAFNTGFSSPTVMNRVFRENFGMAPGKYRETVQKEENHDSPEPDREKALEILQAEEELRVPSSQAIARVQIPADGGTEWGGLKSRILNVGPVISLRSASMQKQVLFLVERMKASHIRLWSPFSDNMRIYDERSGSYSNYSLMDEIMDFCVDHQLNIMMDLTVRKDRQMASEKREIYVSPLREYFRDLEAWLSALEDLLKHLKNRYHEETLRNWVFELTNSLSDGPYHEGRDYSFSRVWEKSYEVIRRILPTARIAGPGLIPDSDMNNQLEEIRNFMNNGRIPDIFTSAHFPYAKSGTIDSHDVFVKSPVRGFMTAETGLIRQALNEAGFHGEYWVTEYGISVTNRNALQDSCYRAAACADEVLPALSNADTVGIFYATDLLSLFSDTMAELSGGGGILTKNGVRKPIYYGFRFIGQLGNIRLASSPNCLATAYHPGELRILCWNRKYLGPRYYMVEEDSFGIDDIVDFFENTDPLPMQLQITGLEQSEYRIRQRVLNMERGSVMKKWQELGGFENLSRDDIEYLSQTAVAEVLSETRTPVEGEMLLSFRMEVNELRMIGLQRL